MTISLFAFIFSVGAMASTLLTQAIKQFFLNKEQECSPNLIAFIDSIVIGGVGTAVTYILMDIAWDVKSIICLVIMVLCIWVGSMIGYDKVTQLIDQLKKKEE